MRAIGRLAAVDLFINNVDRLPFAAENDGNGTNVLLTSDASKPVAAIDHSVGLIGVNDREAHAERVCALVKCPQAGLARVASCLQECVLAQPECLAAFESGLNDGIAAICALDIDAALDASFVPQPTIEATKEVIDFLRFMQDQLRVNL
eukprot:TRINITY_DN4721_c0_g1_i1.p2 TRINITY_DN4721_c0_g1~~TRINITY_DN4721_c0_g1_i1.p2  ORF type:complete len:149 (+),score=31.16 TRINITY_DN4721_c0_g1_i1:558-1004(+)